MDDPDFDAVVGWLRRWGVEATLGVVTVVGFVVGALDGDPLVVVLTVALGCAVADRVRLRQDNHSLSVAVREMRTSGVAAARSNAAAGDAA